jgi:hypothetical protein
MERIKSVVRVCKAASKKPHSCSNTDINHIAAETQSVILLAREGPAVHRELCHVLQALNVSQMQSVRLPGEFKSGIMVYVSTAVDAGHFYAQGLSKQLLPGWLCWH